MDNNSLENIRRYTTHSREAFFKIATRYHQPGSPVLDIGAGAGRFADMLEDKDIYLIEGNLGSVELLRQRYKNTHHVQLPERLPFKSDFFGLIHCSHLIEHLYPHELFEVLKEMDRCLAPNGHLVISTPLQWEGFYDDLSHIKPYTPHVIKNYFCGDLEHVVGERTRSVVARGYKIIDLVYRYRIAPLPYLNISHERIFVQRLLHKLVTALIRVNCGTYERTGYTLVIQKSNI